MTDRPRQKMPASSDRGDSGIGVGRAGPTWAGGPPPSPPRRRRCRGARAHTPLTGGGIRAQNYRATGIRRPGYPPRRRGDQGQALCLGRRGQAFLLGQGHGGEARVLGHQLLGHGVQLVEGDLGGKAMCELPLHLDAGHQVILVGDFPHATHIPSERASCWQPALRRPTRSGGSCTPTLTSERWTLSSRGAS